MTALDSHVHAFAEAQIRRRVDLAARDPIFAELYGDVDAKMVTVESVASTLGDRGFAGALAAGFAFTAQKDCDEQNEGLLDRSFALPLEINALATINLASPSWEVAATKALERGAIGFGELRPLNQGWDPLGSSAARLYGLCLDAGATVLWHVSEPVGHEYPGKRGGIDPAGLCAVALQFPELKQIAAHLGGGLPFYLQMPELRQPLANVWFDTAATSLLYDDQAVSRVVNLVGFKRVLFGSDYPLLSPQLHLKRVLGAIAPEYAGAVCGGNLREMQGRLWK